MKIIGFCYVTKIFRVNRAGDPKEKESKDKSEKVDPSVVMKPAQMAFFKMFTIAEDNKNEGLYR